MTKGGTKILNKFSKLFGILVITNVALVAQVYIPEISYKLPIEPGITVFPKVVKPINNGVIEGRLAQYPNCGSELPGNGKGSIVLDNKDYLGNWRIYTTTIDEKGYFHFADLIPEDTYFLVYRWVSDNCVIVGEGGYYFDGGYEYLNICSPITCYE